MPYEIVKRKSQFCVVKKDTGELVACHKSRIQAVQHMRALYANVPDASSNSARQTQQK